MFRRAPVRLAIGTYAQFLVLSAGKHKGLSPADRSRALTQEYRALKENEPAFEALKAQAQETTFARRETAKRKYRRVVSVSEKKRRDEAAGGVDVTVRAPFDPTRRVSSFAVFVQQNYAAVAHLEHPRDRIRSLAAMYRELRAGEQADAAAKARTRRKKKKAEKPIPAVKSSLKIKGVKTPTTDESEGQ